MPPRRPRHAALLPASLMLALCSAALPAAAHDGPHGDDAAMVIDSRHRQTTPAQKDARAELLARAEAELARGDAVQAGDTFERAAMMLHAADTEMGLVRSYMQAGQYARALAFCAHTAGVHRESPAAGALYAWLLRAGGQTAFAERTLEQGVQRAPDDAVVQETRQAFTALMPVASTPLLRTPHRMAPQAVMLGGQAAVPAAARVVGSAVLLDTGSLAVVPIAAVREAGDQGFWLRNGLGQTTQASVQPDAALQAQGVALVKLKAPMDAGQGMQAAPREPFAGSPGFAVQYAPQQDAQPAWPWLSPGFFGAPALQGRARPLGIELAAGPFGGPVFDAQGRLAGMALPGPSGEATLLPASAWHGDGPPAAAPQAPSPSRVAPTEQVYETALRVTLQVIALPPQSR
ncbi:MAG: hypothetical protein JSS56_13775 [Proteobacteria bacterium]|nr:hypothetical protein [Pseudomonadota bacterium]